MASLNTVRQLGINEKATQGALAKLSSGLRINSAADDAAGLAISEKMRGQISGLNKAVSNAQDGISMVSTAEGSLSETTSILQRMRELAVQAGNDTNTANDRTAMQTEVNQLTSEINRIGNSTEFNTQKLLDGGQSAKGISAGTSGTTGTAAQGGKLLGINATDFTTDPGTLNFATDGDNLEIDVVDAAGASGTFIINGDQFATLWNQTDAAKAGGNATTAMKNQALGSVLGSIASTGNFTMNDGTSRKVTLGEVADVNISSSGILSLQSKVGAGDITIAADGSGGATTDSFGTLLGFGAVDTAGSDITAAGTTAIEATLYGNKVLNATAGADTLEAADWRGQTFSVNYNGRDANITLGAEFGTDPTLKTVTSDDLVTELNKQLDSVFGSGAVTASITTNPNNVNDVNNYFQFTTDSTVMTSGGVANGDIVQETTPKFSISGSHLDQILGSVAADSSAVGGNFNATFQIGANTGQTMTVNIKDMRSQALGISGTVAGGTDTALNGAKASFGKILSASNGSDNNNVEYTLDLSTAAKATAAISIIDDAITKVSAERSNLGAVQNRLEHTINNLGTSSQNVTTAEANIRDVDMAKEMTNFQKNNILQQAAQAMLAQANQQGQGVLQLLR
ncbi:flagellin [Desulfosporosinus sp. Sb-LF]|uniref:flagellin N-terminal helical domain-containing protein n=1 Tax=Desulfosporosinus sp. Sb-LF TaxID=2560027 RepID=UPI00249ED9A3|nr:flagellin [Desulfosporosinus sp. Sb-LF]